MDPTRFEAAVLVVLACLLAGLLLMLVEIVLVPGVGAPGVAGGILLVAGVGYAFWAGGPAWGLLTLGGAAAILGAGLRTLGFTLGHRVMLPEELRTPPPPAGELLGREGVALTPLRPAGLVRIGDRRVDCISRSEWIEAGTPVVVASVESSRVLVERAAEEEAGGQDDAAREAEND